jgi:hypothetical protein
VLAEQLHVLMLHCCCCHCCCWWCCCCGSACRGSLTSPGLSMFPRVFCMYWSLNFSFFSSSTFCRISPLSRPLKSAALVGRADTTTLAPRTVVLLTVAAWNGARVLSILWPTYESHSSAVGGASKRKGAHKNGIYTARVIESPGGLFLADMVSQQNPPIIRNFWKHQALSGRGTCPYSYFICVRLFAPT